MTHREITVDSLCSRCWTPLADHTDAKCIETLYALVEQYVEEIATFRSGPRSFLDRWREIRADRDAKATDLEKSSLALKDALSRLKELEAENKAMKVVVNAALQYEHIEAAGRSMDAEYHWNHVMGPALSALTQKEKV